MCHLPPGALHPRPGRNPLLPKLRPIRPLHWPPLLAGLRLLHATSAPQLPPTTAPLPPTLAPLPSVILPPLPVAAAHPLPPTTGAPQPRPPHHRAPAAPDHHPPPTTPPRPTAGLTDRALAGATREAARGAVVRERGVRPHRSADMSAEMKAAASERRTASVTTGTMTLNRCRHGTAATTGSPGTLESDGTAATEEGKRPESLATTETAGM